MLAPKQIENPTIQMLENGLSLLRAWISVVT